MCLCVSGSSEHDQTHMITSKHGVLHHGLADVTFPSKPCRSSCCAAFTCRRTVGKSTVCTAGKTGKIVSAYALLNNQNLKRGNGESHDESCENNCNQLSGIIFFKALSVSSQNVVVIRL